MDTWEPPWSGRSATSESLGRRIAALRAERGWTQQQLADRLGISRVAVSHLENDINVPGERTVALLAGCFRLEPHDLVGGTTYPPAKADRLPLVAARWTEVEHRLALLERDLWWLDRSALAANEASRLLEGWEADLVVMADRALDPGETAALEAALGGVRRRRRLGADGDSAGRGR